MMSIPLCGLAHNMFFFVPCKGTDITCGGKRKCLVQWIKQEQGKIVEVYFLLL